MRIGTSATVGGGKWTLRNGISNLEILNDFLMITSLKRRIINIVGK
jgi:hypothetical protein